MIIFKAFVYRYYYTNFTFNTLFDTSIESIKLNSYGLQNVLIVALTAAGGYAERYGSRFFINQYKGAIYNFNKSNCKYSLYEEEYL